MREAPKQLAFYLPLYPPYGAEDCTACPST